MAGHGIAAPTVALWPNWKLTGANEHAVKVPLNNFLQMVFRPVQNGPCHTYKETHFLHVSHTSGPRVISGLYPDGHACGRICQPVPWLLFPTPFFGLLMKCELSSSNPISFMQQSAIFIKLRLQITSARRVDVAITCNTSTATDKYPCLYAWQHTQFVPLYNG